MADLVAGELILLNQEVKIITFTAEEEELLNALTPERHGFEQRRQTLHGNITALCTETPLSAIAKPT